MRASQYLANQQARCDGRCRVTDCGYASSSWTNAAACHHEGARPAALVRTGQGRCVRKLTGRERRDPVVGFVNQGGTRRPFVYDVYHRREVIDMLASGVCGLASHTRRVRSGAHSQRRGGRKNKALESCLQHVMRLARAASSHVFLSASITARASLA